MTELTPPARALRELLDGPDTLMVPCCYDGISVRLIQGAGFPMSLLSGFEAAAMSFGLPDTGYLSLPDLVEQMRRVARAAPGFPVIVDGETGYGSPANVRYTVMEHARAGAAGVMIEDQEWPRRCPWLGGSTVIPREEARMRIRAAVEAAGEAGVLVLGRTDAAASIGFEEALERCREFEVEGVDMMAMEGLESEQEIADFCSSVRVPTIANQHPGLKTPFLGFDRCRELGLKMLGYHPMMLTATKALQDALATLADTRGYEGAPPRLGLHEMADLVGFQHYLELEDRYRPDGGTASPRDRSAGVLTSDGRGQR